MGRSSGRIVLVRPRDPNNIGAVARAMKNFGLADLWVVTPHRPVWEEVVSAVNAADILTGARVVNSLEEAIADCNLVVGTTDRTRVEEKQTLYTPVDLVRELGQRDYRLALVFGSEKHGLTNENISRCHRLMSIPTRPDCPSMNLGQAVAVCCYELVRADAQARIQNESAGFVPPEAASAGATESALRLAIDVLQSIDFVLPGNEPDLRCRVRSALLRLNLNEYDIGMLCGILSRIKRGLTLRESELPEQPKQPELNDKKEVVKIDNE